MNAASATMPATPSLLRRSLQDGLASVVVFLVALPLCMGVAIASGMPPAAGLLTGMIGGILVGAIQSPALQVSGPTATLAVTILALVQTRGVAAVGVVVLAAGFIQLLAGALRLGRWFRVVPASVVYGMLAGIGILIAASQFHLVVDDQPRGSGLANLVTIPLAVWKGLMPIDGSNHHTAAAIGLLTIAVMVAWNTVVPKKARIVPAPLVAVVLATSAAAAFGLKIRYVAVPESLAASLALPAWSSLRLLADPAVLGTALTVAFIASAETLLSAAAVDRLSRGDKSNYDVGLMTQGLGNMACGLVGALPMAGVIVRSTANAEAGARTRLSVVLHGLWLCGAVVLLPFLLGRVPVACLAAILVYTGYRLIDIAVIKRLREFGRAEVLIYAGTVVAIVATDLLKGVIIGVVLAVVRLLYTFGHLSIRLDDDPERRRAVLHLHGSATFLRTPELARALASVAPDRELHVRCDDLHYLDHTTLELLSEWSREHRTRGGSVVIEWSELARRTQRPGTQRRAGEDIAVTTPTATTAITPITPMEAPAATARLAEPLEAAAE